MKILTKVSYFYPNKLERPNIGLRILSNGDLVYLDSISHDLVKLSNDMKELGRIKGYPMPESYLQTAYSFNRLRRTTYSNEGDLFLWLKGINNLSIVDLEEFREIEEITNFWRDKQGWCFAMSAVATTDMNLIAGFGYSNVLGHSLHIYNRKANDGKVFSLNSLIRSTFLF